MRRVRRERHPLFWWGIGLAAAGLALTVAVIIGGRITPLGIAAPALTAVLGLVLAWQRRGGTPTGGSGQESSPRPSGTLLSGRTDQAWMR